MSLLEVLRRRLDDPWFRDNMKDIRRTREVADSNVYSDVVGARPPNFLLTSFSDESAAVGNPTNPLLNRSTVMNFQ
jgi:hypothetical protein